MSKVPISNGCDLLVGKFTLSKDEAVKKKVLPEIAHCFYSDEFLYVGELPVAVCHRSQSSSKTKEAVKASC